MVAKVNMRLVSACVILTIAFAANAQFVAIPASGEGGRGSGTFRRPTFLPNGDVLIVNGSNAAELYQSSTRIFSHAGVFPVNVLSGASTIGLLDGRAVVTGGGNSNVDVRNYVLIWNPQARLFRQVTGMLSGRRGHAMLQLDANTLLIIGGEGSPDTWETYDLRHEKPITSGVLPLSLNTVVTFDHPTGTILFMSGSHAVAFNRSTFSFAAAHGLPPAFAGGAAAEMLGDGRLLVTGGISPGGPNLRGVSAALILDPLDGNQETVAPMLNARFWHAATRLPSGKVLITGGSDDCAGRCRPAVAPAEVFDPATKSFTSVESMNFPRLNHVAVPLTSGAILLIGGENGTDSLPGPELYVREASGPTKRRAVRH